ncbi:MAG: PTS sugar transporter subunit IIA [Treponema sp.]|nr:PTS sugar transporter subunit IIA [Treponema sp.]
MVLQHIFSEKNIFFNLDSTDKDELFEEMVQHFVEADPSLNRQEVLSSLIKREESMSTGVMPGIAIPHGILSSLKHTHGAIGISRKGIDYDSLDGKPVHYVFMFLFSEKETDVHLKALKELSFLLQDREFLESLADVNTPALLMDLIKKKTL